MRPVAVAMCLVPTLACAPAVVDPSDDPADYEVDTSVEYDVTLSEPRVVAPTNAPRGMFPVLASNNNVAIHHHKGRLYFAWRTAETHFASANTATHVIASDDGGATWTHEHTVTLGSDAREQQLITDSSGRLWLSFFQGGTNKFAFEPQALWRSVRDDDTGSWSALEAWGTPGEVPWDLKKRGDVYMLTSYTGGHYDFTAEESALDLHLQISDDGLTWRHVNPDRVSVYRGGASEAAVELDVDGSLWALLRNEDGDASGFGSLVCHAPADDLAAWDCPARSDPERYDSPKLFRHGDDIYAIARRDIGGPFDQGDDELSLADRRRAYNAAYWVRPKRSALYRLNRDARALEHVVDLPSAGDTAFPSIRRTGAHTFLVANYTSPVNDPDRTWIEGQEAVDGTSIYLIELTFSPR